MKATVNEIKVSYSTGTKLENMPKITQSKDAAAILFDNWDLDTIELQETFKIVLLNRANKVKGITTISTGSICGSLVDLRIIFSIVLKTLSTGIILAHNHPSGNLKPSQADKDITKRIKDAAKLFDVNVLDHIILAPNKDYFSLADNGYIS